MISVVVIRYRVTNVCVRRTPCTHILLLSLLLLLYNIIASFITIYLTTMGTYLDNPITEKVSEDMEDDTLVCGVSSMQGWRIRQEDAHFCLLDFDKNMSLFGVFDGHGGAEVARLAVEVLPDMIRNQPFNIGDYENALKNAYLDFDLYLRSKTALNRMKILAAQDDLANVDDANVDDKKDNKNSNAVKEDINKMYGFYSGCTAVVALIVDKKKLFVANIGDSRCVVAVHGTKAIDMSKDHKPRDEPELLRIRAAGARVTYDGRINRDLNLSRAFGDHMYKQNNLLRETEQVVIALPDVQARILNAEYGDFIVLGCDGIWDSLSSQATVDLISNHIHEPDIKLSEICEKLLGKCFSAERRSKGVDNMTCIIVKFKPKQRQLDQSDQKDGDHIACKLKVLGLH
ncbi:protein phosphatase ppm-1.G-like isoform X2 [Metopolophium dirhodum]|uniref:protein phosphatase ppm-1.G-like isoform X2 n=1 Tax=Metopolophium dirhodum TaxID=44670 RepID=UPI00298FD6D7|nr:protein phosphatase ppm-1.G-like isoform X2 [Metopolophium dirhodum]